MRRVRSALAAIVLALASRAPAAVLARDGAARAPIIVAAEATRAERTAAEELAGYLGKITGARFDVVDEPTTLPPGPAILVGPTALAARVGLSPRRLGPEEWAIRAEGGRLLLTGGRPRGTLYAVYHYLEDDLGVRWWTPFDETVPRRRTLALGREDRRAAPAFAFRDLYGLDGRAEFRVRNRLNGDASGITERFGGREAFGSPWYVHSFYFWFPPDVYFDSHPEYYAQRAGFRAAGRSQLCLTNPDLPGLLAAKIDALATRNERAAAERRTSLPVYYDFSQNDWGGPCGCDACAARTKREGSEAGPLLALLNDVASRLRPAHPEVRLVTLAYTYTFPPPRTIKPDSALVVRLSGYGKRDFARGAADPANRVFSDAVTSWSRICGHLWIWDYAVVFFQSQRNFPTPTHRFFAGDLRFYRRQGVEGVFAQHDFPIAGDLHDMKVWLYAKLLENPDLDESALEREFTDGFYGGAGPWIRRYLRRLEAAADALPSRIGAESEPDAYTFLDAALVRDAESLFDRADASVAGNAVLARRVRHARLSLDYAALLLAPRFGDERRRGAYPDLRAIADRYRRTWREQIDARVDEGEREAMRAALDEEADALLAGAGEAR